MKKAFVFLKLVAFSLILTILILVCLINIVRDYKPKRKFSDIINDLKELKFKYNIYNREKQGD